MQEVILVPYAPKTNLYLEYFAVVNWYSNRNTTLLKSFVCGAIVMFSHFHDQGFLVIGVGKMSCDLCHVFWLLYHVKFLIFY